MSDLDRREYHTVVLAMLLHNVGKEKRVRKEG